MKPLLIASVVTGLTAAAGTVLMNAPHIVAHVNNTKTAPKVTQIEEVKYIPQEPVVEYKSRTTKTGHVVTAKVSDIQCYWTTDDDGQSDYQICNVNGVITDLTGAKKHFSSGDNYCLRKYHQDTQHFEGGKIYSSDAYYPMFNHDNIACDFGVGN